MIEWVIDAIGACWAVVLFLWDTFKDRAMGRRCLFCRCWFLLPVESDRAWTIPGCCRFDCSEQYLWQKHQVKKEK